MHPKNKACHLNLSLQEEFNPKKNQEVSRLLPFIKKKPTFPTPTVFLVIVTLGRLILVWFSRRNFAQDDESHHETWHYYHGRPKTRPTPATRVKENFDLIPDPVTFIQ